MFSCMLIATKFAQRISRGTKYCNDFNTNTNARTCARARARAHVRAFGSKKNRNFKRLKNREVSSDLDETLIEFIAATQTFIWKSFRRHTGSKNTFSKFCSRETLKFVNKFVKKNYLGFYSQSRSPQLWKTFAGGASPFLRLPTRRPLLPSRLV